LFSRMFGGGKAHLALVGSDDPLEAGLEIYAQPPGKKLSTLSLLSGGEQALTALSLIFAVFKCNPAPISVLDEVDAPLDDANVERFCTLLEDMVRETGTRFMVVTHHHLTMARMDRLYGVTMQERGISRLLSVDLARAVDMVDPNQTMAAALRSRRYSGIIVSAMSPANGTHVIQKRSAPSWISTDSNRAATMSITVTMMRLIANCHPSTDQFTSDLPAALPRSHLNMA